MDVDYGGSTGYGREYRRRLDGQWGVVDVDDCVAAARVPGRARRRRPGPPGDRGRQRGRLHDARRARVPRRLRGRHQPVRDRRPGAARDRAPQVRIALHAPPGRSVSGGGRAATASARRTTSWTASRAPCSSSRDSMTRSSRRPRRSRSWRPWPPMGSRTRTSPSRARATDSAAHTPSGGPSRLACSFLGQVFGFAPDDQLEPLEVPGLDTWAARRPRSALGVTEASTRT